ncbi:vacuolar protein sorting protein VPS4 [Acrasis kona]|uniref:Vacuolar protein sorting protein VPS4 n=1 Tax=Acrasis kona TaxID=1008807 RepID=A0AAW2Z039_9EUKA
MSYVDFVTPAIEHARQATTADEKKSYDEAQKLYLKAIDFFLTAIKHEKNIKKKEMLKGKVGELLERAEQIKKFLQQQAEEKDESVDGAGPSGTGVKAPSKDAKKDGKNDRDKEKEQHLGALEGAIVREKPNIKWSDVAGLEGAKEALKEAVILPIKFPQLFTGKRSPWSGILLYGPPGTGKSYLAKAVATEADSTFFSVSSSDLVSKWQGESEKLVRTLFEMARENKPSIIFIDEIDSMCGNRTDGENDSTRRIKTEFLVQMQGVGKDTQGVLVLAATNIPWQLDPAIRRRFERRVYIPLPDEMARLAMFKIHIGTTPNMISGRELEMLAKESNGYSGSDISILVRNALMEPVRTCQIATHFVRVSGPCPRNPDVIVDDLLTPCSPGTSDALEMSLIEVPSEKLLPPPVTYLDFKKALKTSRPSVGQDDLGVYVNFTEQYGMEG